MRLSSATAVLAVLCCGAAGAAVPETAAVELVRPAPGEVLAAGSDRPAVSHGSGERNAALSRRTAAPVSLSGERRPRPLRKPPDPRAEDRPLPPSSILLLDCRRNE